MTLVLGQLLSRRVLAPEHLRMRVCTDESLCAKAGCMKKQDKEQLWWCPLTAFLDGKALQAAGVVMPKDESKYLRNKAIKIVKAAYENFYNPQQLWLDSIPPSVKPVADGTIPADSKFDFWSYHLGCELSYFRQKQEHWTARRKEKKVFSFLTEFGGIKDEVLDLDGTPHNIGHTPIQWATPAGIRAAQSVWERGVVYNSQITTFASAVSEQLTASSETGSYLCVHLRRGDFIKAGWLGKASDLTFVAANIQQRLQRGEALYISTDEQNPADRDVFRKLGARFFNDFRPMFTEKAFGASANLLGFEDYVGLVEQSICASRSARMFMGSKCSSYTGNILNLRRRYLGDESEVYVISEEDTK